MNHTIYDVLIFGGLCLILGICFGGLCAWWRLDKLEKKQAGIKLAHRAIRDDITVLYEREQAKSKTSSTSPSAVDDVCADAFCRGSTIEGICMTCGGMKS